MDLVNDLVQTWLQHHPAICAVLLLLVAHLYAQTWTIRRVMHMRKGDGFWLRGPRKPPPKPSRRSKPPV